MSAALGDLVNMRGVVTTLTNAFSGLAKMFTEMAETELETTVRQLGELGDAAVELRLEMLNIRMQQMELDAIEKKTTLDANKIRENIVSSDAKRLGFTQDLANLQLDLLKNYGGEDKIRARLAQMANQEKMANTENSILLKEQNKEEKNKLNSLLSNVNLLKFLIKQENERKLTLEENLTFASLYEQVQRQILGLTSGIAKNKEGEAGSAEKILALTKEQQALLDEGEALRLTAREDLFSKHFTKILSLAQQNIEQRKQSELQALRDTDRFRNASAEQRQDMEKDALKKFKKQQAVIFKINKANEIVKTIMSTHKTVAEIMLLSAKLKAEALAISITNPVKSAAMMAAAGGLKGLGIATGALGAAQAGIIAGQQPPAFARGGSFITGGQQMIMVGDNPGGRERVDITPLSSPDFGDAGGGGSINVNIMGNVIGTQEFVRDNLLPEIENSIRRNLA